MHGANAVASNAAPQLFLPVSSTTVQALIARHPDPAELLKRLSGPERCALFIVQQVAELNSHTRSAAVVESLLSELISTTKDADPQNFASELLTHLDPAKLKTGQDLCGELGIVLLTDEEIGRRDFLTATREWDTGYAARRERERLDYEAHFTISGVPASSSLTHEQYRVPQTLLGTLDDHLHVQGYAGTGKTHLIRIAVDTLLAQGVPAWRILVLTYTWGQREAIRKHLPTDVACRTVNHVVKDILPNTLLDPTVTHLRKRSAATDTISDERVAQHYGLVEVGDLSAIQLARLAKLTLSRFCVSDDPVIEQKHLPAGYGPSLLRGNDPTYTERAEVIVKTAKALWGDTQLPSSPDFQPPVHGLHQVKFCSLHGLGLPGRYSYVIADESHDLSPAVLQLLNNSSLPGLTFGDNYQNLAARPGFRPSGIRTRHLVSSYRAGAMLEQVVNPLLQVHPIEPRELFTGSRDIPTVIEYYDKPFIPTRATVIVVADNWGLWSWAQRLASNGVAFTLYDSERDLNRFVLNAIDLYHHNIRARHRDIHNFASWEVLDKALRGRSNFQSMSEALQRGYEIKHWNSTFAALQSGRGAVYFLGTVGAVKNMDFDEVLLSPDTVELLWQSEGAKLAAAESALYTAATRVKRRLFVPHSLRDWFEQRDLM